MSKIYLFAMTDSMDNLERKSVLSDKDFVSIFDASKDIVILDKETYLKIAFSLNTVFTIVLSDDREFITGKANVQVAHGIQSALRWVFSLNKNRANIWICADDRLFKECLRLGIADEVHYIPSAFGQKAKPKSVTYLNNQLQYHPDSVAFK